MHQPRSRLVEGERAQTFNHESCLEELFQGAFLFCNRTCFHVQDVGEDARFPKFSVMALLSKHSFIQESVAGIVQDSQF